MKTPDQESIDSWIEVSLEGIEEAIQDIDSGWFKEQDLPVHSVYHSLGMDYASLGRARFLNGEAITIVREAFSEAGKQVLHSFEMAYNVNCFDYIGDKPKRNDQINAGYGQVSWPEVGETTAIDGLNWALMGLDFETAKNIAFWYRDTPDGHKMDPDVNRYVFAYKYVLLDKPEQASELLIETIREYLVTKPKTIGELNYYTMTLMLDAIVQKDADKFNGYLEAHLDFYQRSVIPAEDLWDTDEEFICDAAVALANLALHVGVEITTEHYLMPKGLLSTP